MSSPGNLAVTLCHRLVILQDLSPGNLAVTSAGLPCVIDVGSSVIWGDGFGHLNGQAEVAAEAHISFEPDQTGFVILHSVDLSNLQYHASVGLGTRGWRSELLAKRLECCKSRYSPDLCCTVDIWSAAMLHIHALALSDKSNREERVEALEGLVNCSTLSPIYDLLCSWLGPGVKAPDIIGRLAKQLCHCRREMYTGQGSETTGDSPTRIL